MTDRKHYVIVQCSSCGRLILATSNSSTRTCAYCGKRIALEDARVLAKSTNAEDARLALQEMKSRGHERRAK